MAYDYDTNPYYYPETHGLTIIGQLHDPNACYSFYNLVVWQHEDGRVFYDTDAGCSCPVPFENVGSLDDLEPVTLDTWQGFCNVVHDHCVPYRWDDETGDKVFLDDPQAADKTAILSKVSKILRARI
jgi:hypothetical protein